MSDTLWSPDNPNPATTWESCAPNVATLLSGCSPDVTTEWFDSSSLVPPGFVPVMARIGGVLVPVRASDGKQVIVPAE